MTGVQTCALPISSPGYPEPYVKGQESSTDIEAPEGFAVRLVFQDFDLEPSPDCVRDSVTVSWGRGGGPGGTLRREPPGLEPRGSGRRPAPKHEAYLGGQVYPAHSLPPEARCRPVPPAVWAP